MSVSKEYYSFPYCNYPYTFNDKISYYSNKTICYFMKLCGFGIYSKLIFGHNHHSIIDTNNITIIKLDEMTSYHKTKIKTSLIYGLIGGIIASPIITGLYYYNRINYDYFLTGHKSIVILLSHNIYKTIAHVYNNIQLSIKYDILNHGIKIMNHVDKNISNNNISNKQMVINIRKNINKQKMQWIKYNFNNEINDCCIFNSYYTNLICNFENEHLVNEFIEKLQQLTIRQVDDMAKNTSILKKMRNDFVKDKIYIHLMNIYKDIYSSQIIIDNNNY
ncbi:hypothetical protein QJ854_gp527 [Moumouvirus goulette]|uniref:Uncharacterized protein n=1 Tax=Moumouvirus goulette TaxID=1247379 RepID=M1NMI4_9VIRU|nr:hypothetical protein QJ854_gp527 [Moumouvirus goulette]AGF85255.1 hypothetical protein glt_00446 [Moumouvirus goulette]